MDRELGEFGDLLVEVGEGGFEGLLVVGVGGVGQVVGDTRSGQLKVFDGVFTELLGSGFVGVAGRCLRGFGGLDDLGLYILAFPTSGHITIFAQIGGIGTD